MIQATAKAIVSLFERRGAIRPDEREVYIYGCDIALYTLFSTLGLLALGAALGRLRETALCVGIFYMNQSFGGGIVQAFGPALTLCALSRLAAKRVHPSETSA